MALKFQITQHTRDKELIKKLCSQLGCGRYEENKRNFVNFVVTNFSDIESKIIPLYTNYPIYGVKALDLADFRQLVEIMKTGRHLTLPPSDSPILDWGVGGGLGRIRRN